MRLPGFIGSDDATISQNWNVEGDWNFYVESKARASLPKTPNILIGTPPLRTWARILGNPPSPGSYSPIRNLFFQDGRLFAIAGSRFIEVLGNGSFTDYGGIGLDEGP